MRKIKVATAFGIGLLLVVSAAPAVEAAGPSKKQVERALASRGFPVGPVDGRYDSQTKRALCAWRELTGRSPHRALPSASEAGAIVAGAAARAPRGIRDGVAVNITCQAAYHVVNGEVKRVMAATSGSARHRTRLGDFRVVRSVNGWHRSTLYGAKMYRPLFFSRGMALHGSATDRLVKSYPASHGCVRMKQRDIDYLWKAGMRSSGAVHVYGKWRG